MVINNNTDIMAKREVNDILWRYGWASITSGVQTDRQKFDCDIVAIRDGAVIIGSIALIGSKNAKIRVSDEINDIQQMANIGKPFGFGPDMEVNWMLFIKKTFEDTWYATSSKTPYIKGSEQLSVMESMVK